MRTLAQHSEWQWKSKSNRNNTNLFWMLHFWSFVVFFFSLNNNNSSSLLCSFMFECRFLCCLYQFISNNVKFHWSFQFEIYMLGYSMLLVLLSVLYMCFPLSNRWDEFEYVDFHRCRILEFAFPFTRTRCRNQIYEIRIYNLQLYLFSASLLPNIILLLLGTKAKRNSYVQLVWKSFKLFDCAFALFVLQTVDIACDDEEAKRSLIFIDW